MTDAELSKNLGVLAEQIQRARQDIGEIKTSQTATETRSVTFEKTYIAEHGKMTGAVEKAHTRIDAHEIKISVIKTELFELTKNTREQLKLLTESIQPLIMTSKIIMWIFGVLGAALTALVIAVITGQVQVVFK